MLNRIVNYGELSRPAKRAGWTLIILAAASLSMGGLLIFRSTTRMGQFLERQSTTPEEVNHQVAETIRSVGGGESFLWVAGALVILSLGCFLFGRRTPPVPK